jgi:hypothetical protein
LGVLLASLALPKPLPSKKNKTLPNSKLPWLVKA